MCGVENTLSKSKLVTLLKGDVKDATLVHQRFYLFITEWQFRQKQIRNKPMKMICEIQTLIGKNLAKSW